MVLGQYKRFSSPLFILASYADNCLLLTTPQKPSHIATPLCPKKRQNNTATLRTTLHRDVPTSDTKSTAAGRFTGTKKRQNTPLQTPFIHGTVFT